MKPDVVALLALAVLTLPACSSPPAKAKAPVALHAGVAEDGQRVFGQCRSCHAIGAGVNGVGPSLHAVVGRTAGSLPDYTYSKAMKAAGVVWTEEALQDYLENPRAHVPGTKMTFAGLDDEQDRRDVVAYLKTLS
ncbi:MAG: cytochrome c family protein [Brevundimonas sp.]|nr:MAG: cytochrome c family protein [Brevundimonas sp.]